MFINKFSQYKSNCIQIEKDVLISDLHPLLKYLIITQYVTNIMSQVKTIFDKSGARSSSTSSPRVGCMLLSSGTDPDTTLLTGVFLKAGWDLLLIMAWLPVACQIEIKCRTEIHSIRKWSKNYFFLKWMMNEWVEYE